MFDFKSKDETYRPIRQDSTVIKAIFTLKDEKKNTIYR